MILINPYPNNCLYFRPIKSNKVAFDEWIEIKEGQSIIVLEEHDLTVPAATLAAAVAAEARAAWATREAARAEVAGVAGAEWTKAEKEIKATGKIKGFSALVEDKIMWISHYDVDALKESQ